MTVVTHPHPSPREPRVVIYCLDQDPRTTSSLGILHYTRHLLGELATRDDPGFRVIALLSPANAETLRPATVPAWMDCRVVPGQFATGFGRLRGDHWLAPRLIRAARTTLVHFPKGYLPWRRLPCRVVATLHDAISCHYAAHPPAGMSRLKLRYFDWMTRHALRCADRVLTDSRYSRTELAALVPESAEKIDVVYFGPGMAPAPAVPNQPRSGLLVLGSRFPHKATAETLGLLSAYAAQHAWREPVTVTGLSAWPADWGPRPTGVDLCFVGRVPGAELARLMAGSRALVLLSTLEGFGLPALESYAAGTPVCYRATTSLAELLEGCPGGWDGLTPEGFHCALNATLSLRPEEIGRLSARLNERFNWRHGVDEVLRVYREELARAAR